MEWRVDYTPQYFHLHSAWNRAFCGRNNQWWRSFGHDTCARLPLPVRLYKRRQFADYAVGWQYIFDCSGFPFRLFGSYFEQSRGFYFTNLCRFGFINVFDSSISGRWWYFVYLDGVALIPPLYIFYSNSNRLGRGFFDIFWLSQFVDHDKRYVEWWHFIRY